MGRRSRGGESSAIERYSGLFAERTASMTSSAMRDLMAVTERPEVISLAGGLPDTSTFPADSYAALMGRIAAGQLAKALQYGPTEGLSAARECIREVMAAESVAVEPDDVIVTSGGQQALDIVCKVLIDPGDVIVAEGPTYPGAVSAFTSYQAQVEQVPVDDDGMDTQKLRERLDDLDRRGKRPKLLYLIPNFQNPSGVTLSLERRREVIEIAQERELLILEDNPYGLLRYDGDPLPSLRELDEDELVIYVGTFSKILSPGIRLGWVTAPRPVLEKLNLAKQAADLCSSSLAQHFVAAYVAGGGWPEYISSLRGIYRRRRDVMIESLESELPEGATWTVPKGGLFVWATLPDYIDTTDLLARALRENFAFVPGRAAWVDGSGGSSMRLNFSGADEGEIREGVRRLGAIVGEQVDLFGTMTGRAPKAARKAAIEPQEGGRVVPFTPIEPEAEAGGAA